MCGDICLRLADYLPNIEDDIIICARTMEFCEPLNSKLCIIPRGSNFLSITPVYNMKWTSKFGYVAIKVLNTDIVVDGLNEKGLSCGILTLDNTVYSPVTDRSISILDVCSWILGSCENVNEAVKLLQSVQIYGAVIPVLNRIIGLHIVIHDATGNNIVCELSHNHVMNIYQTNGVVTNDPCYPQQLRLLQKHHNVSSFAKLSELKHLSIPETYDNIGLIQLICHMFNTIDVVRGMSVSIRSYGNLFGTTQWCLIKDLTSKVLYYRSYNNMTLKRLNLCAIDFSGDTIYPDIIIDDVTLSIVDVI